MDKLRRMLGGREADPETGTSDATGLLSGTQVSLFFSISATLPMHFVLKLGVNFFPHVQDNSGEDLDCFGSMSWTNRLTGFGLCFGVGVVFVIFVRRYAIDMLCLTVEQNFNILYYSVCSKDLIDYPFNTQYSTQQRKSICANYYMSILFIL